MEAALNGLDLSTALDTPVTIPDSVLQTEFENVDQECFKLLTELAGGFQIPKIAGLTDLVLSLTDSGKCPSGTAHLLLESAVDYLPLSKVTDLWKVFVSRKAKLIEGIEAVRPLASIANHRMKNHIIHFGICSYIHS